MASTELVLERSFYIGNIITAILYGVELCMFLQSVYYLLTGSSPHRGRIFYILYGAILLILLTFSMATNALFGQLVWIEHRDVPGGPAAYFADNTSMWVNTLGSAANVIANCLGDALLLYRCYMIWGSRLSVIAFPALIFFSSTSMAIMTTIESALPGADIFQGAAANFGVPWIALTVSFNIVITILISTRLLIAHNQVRKVLSPELAKTYTGVVAILVESATPFSVLGIVLVISYSKNSPTEFAFAQVWGIFCTLSPQLIILRVAMGMAWSKETLSQVTRPLAFVGPESVNKGDAPESFDMRPYYGGTTTAVNHVTRSESIQKSNKSSTGAV